MCEKAYSLYYATAIIRRHFQQTELDANVNWQGESMGRADRSAVILSNDTSSRWVVKELLVT